MKESKILSNKIKVNKKGSEEKLMTLKEDSFVRVNGAEETMDLKVLYNSI